jgi:hypothetical protein
LMDAGVDGVTSDLPAVFRAMSTKDAVIDVRGSDPVPEVG